MDLMKVAQEQLVEMKSWPEFKAGDTITVFYKIIEGNKEREQQFQGVVLQRRGTGHTETFTIRKISGGVGVERIFPIHSPKITRIDVNKRGKVRRARIFYLRDMIGKSARIEEKKSKRKNVIILDLYSKSLPQTGGLLFLGRI
jgi:large subunit ribosomal protein L19